MGLWDFLAGLFVGQSVERDRQKAKNAELKRQLKEANNRDWSHDCECEDYNSGYDSPHLRYDECDYAEDHDYSSYNDDVDYQDRYDGGYDDEY